MDVDWRKAIQVKGALSGETRTNPREAICYTLLPQSVLSAGILVALLMSLPWGFAIGVIGSGLIGFFGFLSVNAFVELVLRP